MNSGEKDQSAPQRPFRSALIGRLGQMMPAVARCGRLVCGVPDYEGYVAHLRAHHPECPVPSFEEFFRTRLDRRYGKGGTTRCC